VLDLDLVQTFPAPQPIAALLPWVDDLHAREKQAFETIITDKAREVFDAD
jgi:uncharacterized protein (TIGR04255 family)